MKEKKVSFWRIFWPSLIAAALVSIIGLLIWILVLGSLFQTEPFTVKEKTVLHMKLDMEIGERTDANFNPGSFQIDNQLGLASILHGLKTAKKDPKIKGILLELNGVNCGMSTARELRNAINDFEKSGKFVVAYYKGEYVSTRDLYISSAADEAYGFPTTNLQFLGLGAEMMFFKKLFDKLGVEMQIIRGHNNDFKSAVEPFFRENLSDSARHQAQTYINGLWYDLRNDIATDRKLDVEELDRLANEAAITNMRDAEKYKLIDGLKYRDEVMKIIAKKVKIKNPSDIEFLSFQKYAQEKFLDDQKRYQHDETGSSEYDANIAVILAEGGITTEGDELTSKEICKLFKKARENKSIKAIVFRVNSPGGSALASDEIWREVKLTNKKKPVIVSMGDVAASGGYYISAPAAKIYAEPTTITGSIGVFGVIPYTGAMLEDKLGITFDRVTTNEHSVMTTNRKLTESELEVIQKEVDEIYSQFLDRVATGRGMTKEDVNVIARGRVWTGRDAKRMGLVDELGGLQDAINFAAKKSGVKKQRILYYPYIKKNPLAEILEQLEDNTEELSMKQYAGMPEELNKLYLKVKSLESYRGIQMRLPFEITIY